ncbi:MAG: alpha/beta hydrolase fold domain-containing protein [Fimbriimonadaceae bacterium]|nr:MAG: alpha/beta hydrolase fold domain-containing protein [Fimbriimonadaceae bacterium]
MIELIAAAIAFSDMTSVEVKFQGVGLELAGVITSPPDDGKKHPAFLIMPGSGPTDRDGNQLPTYKTDLLKEIGNNLTEAGFVVMRFDKRPVARYREFWPKTIAEISPFFSLENHLADVEAAFKFLKAQPNVDASRMVLAGHSEGGLFTTALAAKLNPKAICLLAAPGRGMDVILREQLMAQINPLPDSEAKTQLINDLDRAISTSKASTTPATDLHPGLAALFSPANGHILNGYFNFDPISSLKEYTGAVFIANGESDIQINPERDAKPLYNAAMSRENKNVKLLMIPNTSHNFKAVSKASDAGITGPAQPALIAGLKEFLKANVEN